MWFVKGGWNLQLVKALVANNLTADEVALIDDRIQGIRQLTRISVIQFNHVNIRWGIIGVDDQCDMTFVGGKADVAQIAGRQRRQSQLFT